MRRDLIALPDSSRVWIYQSSEPIKPEHSDDIKKALYDFTMNWKSHSASVESYAHLFHNRFLVFVADESSHVSGCSIDSSVHLIKTIGEALEIDFFDRMHLAYLKEDVVHDIHISDIGAKINAGIIDKNTLIFDNMVKDKRSFIDDWVKPIEESWYAKYIP